MKPKSIKEELMVNTIDIPTYNNYYNAMIDLLNTHQPKESHDILTLILSRVSIENDYTQLKGSIEIYCNTKGCKFNMIDIEKKVNDIRFAEEKKAEQVIRLNITNYIENAEAFWNVQPYFHDDQMGVFWLWNAEEFKYEMIKESKLMDLFDTTLGFQGQTVTSGVKNNHLEAFRRYGGRKKPKDAPVKWIQFKDKAFSVNSKGIYQVEPNYFFTNPLPWEIGKTSDTPTMDKLFGEWVGKKHLPDLYEFIAYCCYRGYPIQLLFCLYGHGRNGKSTFINIVDKFLGKNNTCTTDLDMIAGKNKNRFETIRLYKKLACFMGETNFNILENSSILKKLVGGDKIGFEIKGAGLFDDVNYAKIIIASNSLPTSEDTSEGFFRRWHIIDFPNEFPEGKDISLGVPDIEYNNLSRKVMEVLPTLLEKGFFSNQGSIADRKKKYILASNPLPLFIEKYCFSEPNGYIRYNELYMTYTKFLGHKKRRIVSKKEFSKILVSEGLENRKTSKEGEIDYYVEGISLKAKDFLDFLDFKESTTSKFLHMEKCKSREIGEIGEKIDSTKTQDIGITEEYIQDIDLKPELKNNGECKSKKGYVYILKPSHPNCNKSGYVMRSRITMEHKLKRYLTKTEVVHHIDSNTSNDNIENLQLFKNQSEHAKFEKDLKAIKSVISYTKNPYKTHKKCTKCDLKSADGWEWVDDDGNLVCDVCADKI